MTLVELIEGNNILSEQMLQPERPTIRDIPGGIGLCWKYVDIEINAYITHITEKGIAEVTLFYSTPEQEQENRETLLLSTNRIDFLSPTQKASLVRQIENIGYLPSGEPAWLDWERKVNDIALVVMQNFRRNIPAIEIVVDAETPLAAEYIVKPILYKGVPNVIFGDYGSYKSLTAMVLAFIAQLPYSDNKLELEPDTKPTNCLWLDYEGQSVSFKQRWAAIQRGFNLGAWENCPLELPILYKEMTVPLFDAIEPVQYEMIDNNVSMLIIDSLGPAAGGNLNDPEPAIRYHQALRTLGGTSLTLAHNSKDLTTGTKSIFGSVFFSNLARSIWQCKAEKEPMDSRGVVGLKQIKASLSQLHGVFGFALEFNEETNQITIEKSDLRETGLAGELPLSIQIRHTLSSGSMTSTAIAESIDAKKESVRVTLHKMAKKEIVIKNGELWGLLET